MSRTLSNELLQELFAQESGDPFLTLCTLNHPDFDAPYYFVNNTENITSRGVTFVAFPMQFVLPIDDGESDRQVSVVFDNVGLELIQDLRSITTPIECKLEMVLASLPDNVEIELGELKLQNITYDQNRISGQLYLDDFLNTEVTSERYSPSNFPGIF